jgi:hypothetical protein
MGERTTVVPITAANLDVAATTLSRAFADDPILTWMARDRACDTSSAPIPLGTAVLDPMLDRCDTEGVGAYLENSNPRNEALYARLGFVTTGPISLPKGAPPFTAMWREPRSS